MTPYAPVGQASRSHNCLIAVTESDLLSGGVRNRQMKTLLWPEYYILYVIYYLICDMLHVIYYMSYIINYILYMIFVI